MEDLLQRMREVVYHGERAAEKKKKETAKLERTKLRGAEVWDPRKEEGGGDEKNDEDDDTKKKDEAEKNETPRFGPGDVVGKRHALHSAAGSKMEPARREKFRGKCT